MDHPKDQPLCLVDWTPRVHTYCIILCLVLDSQGSHEIMDFILWWDLWGLVGQCRSVHGICDISSHRSQMSRSSFWNVSLHLGVNPKIGGKPPKWMVYFMENPIKVDDLGGNTPYFWFNTHIHLYLRAWWHEILGGGHGIYLSRYLVKVNWGPLQLSRGIDTSWGGRETQRSHEKNPPTFHYTGWLIGILIMVYYNPHITG